jgi:hypothetical protein
MLSLADPAAPADPAVMLYGSYTVHTRICVLLQTQRELFAELIVVRSYGQNMAAAAIKAREMFATQPRRAAVIKS